MGSPVQADSLLSREYVSIDCPKGDITLLLNTDGVFGLELKIWNEETHSHTHSEKLSGKWSYSEGRLVLSGAGTIIYQRDTAELTIGSKISNIDSLNWTSSSPATFADSFTLVEREEVDQFFRGAMPL